ncbi:MAG TPA: FtsX-like permease family protein [Cytophagaceae bacterium]|nr:FtsX-like permease family protein [Cytophagaceae bacterium]
MRKILNKIFIAKLGISRLLLSGSGLIFGLTLVLLALQLYTSLLTVFRPENTTGDYLTVSKDVGLSNMLFSKKAEFSEKELEDLKRQPFVENSGSFIPGHYKVRASSERLGFSTDLFFESVPDQFIDNRPGAFRWYEGSDFVPIILTDQFLDMYNFGFAGANNMPQVSRSTIGLVPLTIKLEGSDGSGEFKGKVVGFSSRISSVLVPEAFMLWTNKKIGRIEKNNPSRVIIKVNKQHAAEVEKYFEKNDLKVDEEKVRLNKIIGIADIMVSVLVGIGFAFIIFSLVIVVMNFSLLIYQAREEISLLRQMGYKNSTLFGHLCKYFIIFYTFSIAISISLFYLLNHWITDSLKGKGIELAEKINSPVMMTGAVFIIVSLIIVMLSLQRSLQKS